MQLVGAVGLELWVESSGRDLDIFAYLEDVDPAGDIRYALQLLCQLLCLICISHMRATMLQP